jgi:hypothetical protein
MYDAVVKAKTTKLDLSIEKWRDFPYSALSHHGKTCCEVSREWLLAMDYSQLCSANALTAPRWIRQRWTWGPCTWSLHWCEAVRRKTLDCGALAAIAHQIFLNRGVESYPVQLIQEFNPDAVNQWQTKWESDECSPHWLSDDLIYHEGCAVVTAENEIKLWDASAGWWINPNQPKGYGSLVAVKIHTDNASASFKWGAHRINSNIWQKLKFV